MPEPTQSYANHAQNRPVYWAVYAIFVADLVWTTYRAIQAPNAGTILGVLTSIALITLALYARIFALTVQDRVIRLEMRLRLRELLPATLHARIGEFSKGQLVAMRFASDAELPAIAETVLREKIQDRNAIKKMIKDWQPDFLRV
jgi:hypothetical protein